MKITVFIGSLYGGGAERVACSLGDYLTKKGHVVEFLTMAESKTYKMENTIKRTILLNDNDRKNFIHNSLCRLRRLFSFLSQDNSDCIVVMLPVTTILLLLIRKRVKGKVIASERSDPSRYSWINRTLLRWLAPRADCFIFQTKEARNWYGKRIIESNAVIIPNAINQEFIELGKREKNKKEIIVGMGRLNEIKNFELLIESFALIADDFPNYELHIYGDGASKQKLIELAELKNLENRVYIPGQVDKIAERVAQASLFVLSSNYEGMPNALMEAMALGVPCVATDCGGGVRFLITDRVNGIIVPVNDKQEMANAIRTLLSDRDLATQMGNKSKQITEYLSPDIIYSKWERTIVETCG